MNYFFNIITSVFFFLITEIFWLFFWRNDWWSILDVVKRIGFYYNFSNFPMQNQRNQCVNARTCAKVSVLGAWLLENFTLQVPIRCRLWLLFKVRHFLLLTRQHLFWLAVINLFTFYFSSKSWKKYFLAGKIHQRDQFLIFFTFFQLLITSFNWEKFCWLTNKNLFSQQK